MEHNWRANTMAGVAARVSTAKDSELRLEGCRVYLDLISELHPPI